MWKLNFLLTIKQAFLWITTLSCYHSPSEMPALSEAMEYEQTKAGESCEWNHGVFLSFFSTEKRSFSKRKVVFLKYIVLWQIRCHFSGSKGSHFKYPFITFRLGTPIDYIPLALTTCCPCLDTIVPWTFTFFVGKYHVKLREDKYTCCCPLLEGHVRIQYGNPWLDYLQLHWDSLEFLVTWTHATFRALSKASVKEQITTEPY